MSTPKTPSEARASETKPLDGCRVLVADPSPHMASLVAMMLRSVGVRQSRDTHDLRQLALELGREPFDLVLLDEQFGSAVLDLVREIRRSPDHPNRTTAIFMTAASPTTRTIAEARNAGITEFLRKPYSAKVVALRFASTRNAPRSFVEVDAYAGPDRRRRDVANVASRRAGDRDTEG